MVFIQENGAGSWFPVCANMLLQQSSPIYGNGIRHFPRLTDNAPEGQCPDVLIIGGISGAFIARVLSKWTPDVLPVEKESDSAMLGV